MPPIRNVDLLRRQGAESLPASDQVAVEEPLEIRFGDEPLATLMRTPGHDEELAAGFLLSEGIIRERADLERLVRASSPGASDAENHLNVFLRSAPRLDLAAVRRRLVTSSACGVCSRTSIASLARAFPRVESGIRVSASLLYDLPASLHAQQATFARTGGLHACALFDAAGRLLLLREDVGRHNAVDKVIGHAFLQGWLPLRGHILMVSGRVAFEIVQKALSAGLPVIAAISAPTSLAIDLARENGQTLIGFLRDRRMNIYTHPHRVE